MANDEPRRSGRTTKGQHTKNELLEPAQTKKKAKHPAAKKKASAAAAKASEDNAATSGEDANDDEEIIRCICGEYEEEEDIERDMICCDNCSAWQHNDCMGLHFPKGEEPEQYYCEKCRPENHQELLEKIENGEKPWEEAARQRAARIAELKKKKKGKKGGRKSSAAAGGTNSRAGSQKAGRSTSPEAGKRERTTSARPSVSARATPTEPKPEPEAEPEAESVQQPKCSASSASQHSEQEDESTSPAAPKRKSEHVAEPSSEPAPKQQRVSQEPETKPVPSEPQADPEQANPEPEQQDQAPQEQTPAADAEVPEPQQPSEEPQQQAELSQDEILNSLTPTRRKVADALGKLLRDIMPAALTKETFQLPPNQTVPQASTGLALAIENAMYKNHCNASGEPNEGYKQQLRTILFNVKRNPALRDGVLSGTITPDRLSTMSTRDMASEEQRQKDEEIKKEAERQHMIVQESLPRIRRTHKGEEIVEDDTQVVANESIFSAAPRRDTIASLPASRDGEKRHRSPRHHSPSPSPKLEGRNENHITDWERSASPGAFDGEQRFGGPIGHEFQYHPRSPVTRAEADEEIDALLGDEDEDEVPYSPPYSPKPFLHSDVVVWSGTLAMASAGQFRGEARHVGGADLSERLPWSQLMPPTLVIDGRIDVKLATAYLCGLRFSKTTDVCVTAIQEPLVESDRKEFNKIFDYFSQRERYGVIGLHTHQMVKDLYVVPVEKGGGDGTVKKPEFLDLLENNCVEEPVKERLLLVVYVVRNGESSRTNTPQTASSFSNQAGVQHKSSQLQQQPQNEAESRPVQPLSSAATSDSGISQAGTVSTAMAKSGITIPALQAFANSGSTPTPISAGSPITPAATQQSSQLPFSGTTAGFSQQMQQPPLSLPQQPTAQSTPTLPSAAPSYPAQTFPSPQVAIPGIAPNPIAAQIFGQYATSPAVRELLSRAPTAEEAQLRIVAGLIAQNPAAAMDYNVLAGMIVESGRGGNR